MNNKVLGFWSLTQTILNIEKHKKAALDGSSDTHFSMFLCFFVLFSNSELLK